MLGKLFSSIITAMFCGIPTWLYLLARWLLEPQGFLAEFLVLGLGLYVLGAAQFFLFIFWIVLLLAIWNSAHTSRFSRR